MIRSVASKVRSGFAASTCALLLIIGCNPPGKPDPQDRPVPADAVTNFDLLFATNCAGCHGTSGMLGPAPPLNDPLFLSIVPDEVIADVIRHGRPDTPMPAFGRSAGGTLADEQIAVLAGQMKSQWLAAGENELPPNPPAYLDAKPTDAPAAEAQQTFTQACAGCHGDDGHGGDAGTINDPAFLSLISDQELRRIVITGRPDLGMPNFADSSGRGDHFKPLTSDQVSGIVALLGQWRAASQNSSTMSGATSSSGGAQ